MKEMIDRETILCIIRKNENSKDQLIQILLELQEGSEDNCLKREWIELVAEELNVPLSKVYDVVTFYAMFTTEPQGKYVIEVCKSAPCHVRKSGAVAEMFEKALGIKLGGTTEDKLFTLKHTSCIGACDISPAAKIGNKVYGNLTEEKIDEIIKSYREESK